MTEYVSQPDNQAESNRLATEIFSQSVAATVQRKQRVVLAFAGGRSVGGLMEALALADFNWGRVEIFMVDERLVPLDHSDSNFHQLNEQLLQKLVTAGKLTTSQIHPFVYQPSQPAGGLGAYEAALQTVGGRYDIIVLGVGEDGHLGALFPAHHSIRDQAPLFISFDDSPKPPAGRMSASRTLLSQADYALTFVLGEAKRAAYQRYLDKSLTVEDCPLKLIDSIAHSYLFTDLATL